MRAASQHRIGSKVRFSLLLGRQLKILILSSHSTIVACLSDRRLGTWLIASLKLKPLRPETHGR
jgi:hypothetical protein